VSTCVVVDSLVGTIQLTLALSCFSAGGWCVVDDGDEEIIELRSGVPWRQHLAQASSSSSSPTTTTTAAAATSAAVATTAIAAVQSHSYAHASHTLPLTFTPTQSPCAQTPSTSVEAETGLFGHHLGSRYDCPSTTEYLLSHSIMFTMSSDMSIVMVKFAWDNLKHRGL